MIFCICSNCLNSLFTSSTFWPLPAAIRRFREGLMSLGFPFCRGHRPDQGFHMDQLFVVDILFLDLVPAGKHPDNLPQGAHLLNLLHLG